MSRTREEIAALALAVKLLTRIPLRRSEEEPSTPVAPSAAVPYYPLVGMLVGAISGIVFCLAHLVFPVTLAVLLATAASLLATGALHEDGFADACDGLGGGATRERALEIMRDSRLGTYGVAGLGLMLAAKVLALSAAPVEAIPWLLVVAHAASRASAGFALATGAYARVDGIATSLADAPAARGGVAFAVLVGVGAFALLLLESPPATLVGGFVGLALGHFLMRRAYERKLGGYTGDCLGGVQQASELGLYLGALAAM